MEKFDLLKKVRKVDAPPFLLTRIQARIRRNEAERLPTSWQWAGGLAFGLLLLLNALAINQPATQSGSSDPSESLVQNFQLDQTNQLYVEQN